jgi:hypothetical protein
MTRNGSTWWRGRRSATDTLNVVGQPILSFGNCRLLSPLTHELAETMPAWRRLIAPVVERVTSTLLRSEKKLERAPTPLTEANRRADRARRGGVQPEPAKLVKLARPEPRCKRCDGGLPHRDRIYCDGCLPRYRREQYAGYAKAGVEAMAGRREAGDDPSHGGEGSPPPRNIHLAAVAGASRLEDRER